MLSRSNAALVHRDRALPGLGLLLDAEALRDTIELHLDTGPFTSFVVDYVRYKPGRNCLVRFRATTEAIQSGISGYAKAYRVDAGVKIEKARIRDTAGSLIGPGRLVIPDHCLEICFLPNDNKLEQLPKLNTNGVAPSILDRLQPEGAGWDRGTLTVLNYKPERRYVSRLDIPGKPPVVVRLYSADEYNPTPALDPGNVHGIRIPQIVGRSNTKRAIVVTWLDGEPLSDFFPASPDLDAAIESTGAALAALYLTTMPASTPRHQPENQMAGIRATSETLQALLPSAGDRIGSLGASICAALASSRPSRSMIHGDLHARQIIVNGDTIGLIDLDEVRPGDPGYDLGLLLAHFDRDARVNGWDSRLPANWADILLRGYVSQGGQIDLQRIAAGRAAAHFQLLPHHFRHCLPDWPDQILAGLEQIRELLRAPVRYHLAAQV